MASTYFSRTNVGSPTNNKIFTLSCWVKKYAAPASDFETIFGGSGSSGQADTFGFGSGTNSSGNSLHMRDSSVGSYNLVTTRLFRDVNAWYHIVVAIDTTQATASNRVKIYVNGVQETSFSTATYPSQNYVFDWNAANLTLAILGARANTANTWNLNASLAHVHLTDGTAYDASSFGETDATTGIWKPKTAPSVTYGTNGFFLKFENSGSLGLDSSGNGNNFTVNGTPTQTVDTPSNVFATFNAVAAPYSAPTLSNGNTTTTNNSADYDAAFGTFAVSKGKWYWELKKTDTAAAYNDGVFDVDANSFGVLNPMNVSTGYTGFYNTSGGQMRKDNATSGSYGTFANGDIMGIALDMDNKQISIYKNGTIHVSNFAISTGCLNVVPTAIYYQTGSSQYNFGNGYFGTTAVSSGNADDNGLGIFEYAPPTGYLALCTKNINEQEYS